MYKYQNTKHLGKVYFTINFEEYDIFSAFDIFLLRSCVV